MCSDCPHRRAVLGTFLVLATLAAAACEDEVVGPGDEFTEGELTLEATSNSTFTYMTFAGEGSVVSLTDPQTSTEWAIAFRRYSAKLNGGVAGPGDVAGANLANNAGSTAEQVVAFTEADGLAAFEAVTAADISGVTFVEDGLAEDMGGSWFRFDPMAGTLVANPGAAWKVREADGGYALFRISELVMAGLAPSSITVEYRHQDSGGTLGSIGTVEVDLTGGSGYVDLGTGSVVTDNACDWDLVLTPMFVIAFNDGCDAGTFPLDATEDFTTITNADDAPEYGGFLSVLSGAFPSTIDDAGGIFWYDIEGNNRLWPTYNVFLVRVGADVYKVQVVDYYSATGEAGHPTVRFEQIQ
jgi:hypothetical protein